jgi:hypothetical protein
VIARADSRLGRGVAALAVMLMALLVVQTPIATVDRLLHEAGRGHAANAFVGAVVDLPEHHHDHDHDHASPSASHDDDAASAVQTVADASSDAPGPGLNHHHHDGPSAYGLTDGVTLPVVWSSSAMPFRLADDLRKGVDRFQRDRPPKTPLSHVA